uniref:Uncharacterized protein n=1 Tax=Peronospora matthiolae TaxID=2874970 RepID=A0AAV1VK32_9STRA
MRTNPTFYAGRLRPYYQYEPVSRGERHLRGQGPRPPSSGPVPTSQPRRLAKRPAHAVKRRPEALQSARHEDNKYGVISQVARTQKRHNRSIDRTLGNCNNPLQDPQAHNAQSVQEPSHLETVPLHGRALEHQADPTLEPDQVFRPPPHPLVDSSGGQRFLVERILNHLDLNGFQTSNLVL